MTINKTRNIILVACLSLLVLPGCWNDDDDCDWTITCDTVRPDSSWLDLELTINSDNPWVAVQIFDGKVDEGTLVVTDTTSDATSSYFLPTSTRYSVRATYKEGLLTTHVVDGGRLDYDSFTNCDDRCYQNKVLTLDLTLLD